MPAKYAKAREKKSHSFFATFRLFRGQSISPILRDLCVKNHPRKPRKFDLLTEYFGNSKFRSLVPRCRFATSANTSRKSVVTARSRPSLSWSDRNPFQSP